MSVRDCGTIGLVSGLVTAVTCSAVLAWLDVSSANFGTQRSLWYARGAMLGLDLAIGPTCGTIFYWLRSRR